MTTNDKKPEGLTILAEPAGSNGQACITLALDGKTIDVDTFNVAKATARDRYAARIVKQFPGIGAEVLRDKLLQEAGKLTAPKPAAGGDAPELDLSTIVRPELFHTPAVSGVLIPVATVSGGKPAGYWRLHLRWHDSGKRECMALEESIDLPDGRRLWFHPVPADPDPTNRPGWTARGRAAWTTGAAAPDPVDLFKRLCERLAYFLEFPPDAAMGNAATLALWAMFTYIYPVWRAVPYLSVGGTLSSGKSTVFAVLMRVVFRAVASSNLTAACLFRTLHDLGGTLLLDEAERLRDSTPDVGEIRSILLSGYKAGSPAMRLEKTGDTFKRIAFDVFGPKAIAGIASLPEALATRCIRLTMFRAAMNSPKPRRPIDGDPAAWAALRDDLHALALEHGPTWLALSERADDCPSVLAGRDYELWQPILALAAWLEDCGAAGLLAMMQEHAEASAADGREDATSDADETLLRIVAENVIRGTHYHLKASGILKLAREAEPHAFERWTAKGIGTALKRYGLRTHKGTGNTGRTYAKVTVEQLRHVESAYVIELELPGGNVPHVPHVPQSGVSEPGAAVSCGT